VFFRELVLEGEYSDKMNRMNGNSQIVEAVTNDKSGIGYVGVGYAKQATGITVVNVADTKGGYYASPLNAEEVKSGKYPIARPLNQYLNGAPKGIVKEFIKFELGPKGQKIVEDEGFFPPTAEDQKINNELGL
jgi:phosphate transport system substrate-binding protein